MISDLPVLQVVIPLAAAPVCLLLRNPRHAWACALIASWLVLAIALMLVQRVHAVGTLSYAIGAWVAPWGIEYRIDMAGALMVLVVAIIGALVMPFARRSIEHEILEKCTGLFYTCYLLCLCGLLGMVVTGDAFNLFVFLEISSLSSYVLISLGSRRRALTAAYQYLIMGTIGATFILIGVGLLYMMTGTLNMVDLSQRLPEVANTRTIMAAFAFVTVGVSIKLALFPLHQWLPNAYTDAPSVVSAFIAATATKVGVYVLLRFFFTVFGMQFSFDAMHVGEILMLLAVAGILIASLVAVFQDNVKRMLAYSSVAQIGYIILGISMASAAGVSAGMIHLFNHAMIKGALFLAIGCIFLRLGSAELRDMHGLARHMPWTMAAFVAGGLSLIGIPLTSGFISKWYLASAALSGGYWPLVVLILASSLIGLIYMWRVVEVAYFHVPGTMMHKVREAPAVMLIPTWLLIGINLYVGMDASLITDITRQGAEILIGEALQ
ncbi:MAG: monovalent cation/H+ antiporter subunit D family protein [Gammaproteobacteria bacterium]|nr:MAG: monovalent cation/H+ antiporter subunit D family protein [Gammaproteobacteria bacterium]